MQEFIGDWISYQLPKLAGWLSRNLYKESQLNPHNEEDDDAEICLC